MLLDGDSPMLFVCDLYPGSVYTCLDLLCLYEL
jgi:hypothetical protein